MTSAAVFPRSFLDQHFVGFMDAFSDGHIGSLPVEDLVITPRDEGEAARSWGVVNDIDMDRCDELLVQWRTYRAATPPPVPDNITVGES